VTNQGHSRNQSCCEIYDIENVYFIRSPTL